MVALLRIAAVEILIMKVKMNQIGLQKASWAYRLLEEQPHSRFDLVTKMDVRDQPLRPGRFYPRVRAPISI